MNIPVFSNRTIGNKSHSPLTRNTSSPTQKKQNKLVIYLNNYKVICDIIVQLQLLCCKNLGKTTKKTEKRMENYEKVRFHWSFHFHF